MLAHYKVRADCADLYPSMAKACGAKAYKLQPLEGNQADLFIRGNEDAIKRFSNDLGWGPE